VRVYTIGLINPVFSHTCSGQMTLFTLLFALFLLLDASLRFWLARRQVAHVMYHRDAVPAIFADQISLRSHQRAADYTVARVRMGLIERIVDAGVLVGLTLLGGLQAIDFGLMRWIDNDFIRQLLLLASVGVIMMLIGLPFSLWRQFRLEARFGFNRMTLPLFFSDLAKNIVLSTLLGLPLAAAVLWLMTEAGTLWWLWAWLLWVAFNLVMLVAFPLWIAPLFNRFTPLEDETLAGRIRNLATRCGFPLDGLFVMDGSRRSAHGNAYFTGFGKARRIVFFDTLLSRLNHDQIEAVLAHELGHFHHRHILKRIVVSFTLSLGFFALLGWLSTQLWFYAGLGIAPMLNGSHHAMALVLFCLVVPVFTFPFAFITNMGSRRDEFQADAYAASQSNADHLIAALVRLYDDNAATLTPDPLHSAFYDSHPPAAVRIARLRLAGGAQPA